MRDRQIGKRTVMRNSTINSQPSTISEPLRLRHLPYPRFTRGRGGHCYVFTFNSAQPHICQHHRPINHKPTTLNAPSPQKSPCIAVRLHGNTGENHISCYPETVVYLSHARNNSFRTCVSVSEKPTNRCFVHWTLFPPDGQFSLPPNIQTLF